jgi:hypothetical protein
MKKQVLVNLSVEGKALLVVEDLNADMIAVFTKFALAWRDKDDLVRWRDSVEI